jgi:hypothetical protein
MKNYLRNIIKFIFNLFKGFRKKPKLKIKEEIKEIKIPEPQKETTPKPKKKLHVKKGKVLSERQVRRMKKLQILGKHPLHKYHFGIFSPLKPLKHL